MVINCGYKLFNWMAYHHYEYRNCHYFIWISLIISQNGKYLFSYQHTVLVLVTEENDDSDNLRYCKPTFICDREIVMRFARAWSSRIHISCCRSVLKCVCYIYYFQDNLNLESRKNILSPANREIKLSQKSWFTVSVCSVWNVFLHFYSNVLSQLKLQNLSVSY